MPSLRRNAERTGENQTAEAGRWRSRAPGRGELPAKRAIVSLPFTRLWLSTDLEGELADVHSQQQLDRLLPPLRVEPGKAPSGYRSVACGKTDEEPSAYRKRGVIATENRRCPPRQRRDFVDSTMRGADSSRSRIPFGPKLLPMSPEWTRCPCSNVVSKSLTNSAGGVLLLLAVSLWRPSRALPSVHYGLGNRRGGEIVSVQENT